MLFIFLSVCKNISFSIIKNFFSTILNYLTFSQKPSCQNYIFLNGEKSDKNSFLNINESLPIALCDSYYSLKKNNLLKASYL